MARQTWTCIIVKYVEYNIHIYKPAYLGMQNIMVEISSKPYDQ